MLAQGKFLFPRYHYPYQENEPTFILHYSPLKPPQLHLFCHSVHANLFENFPFIPSSQRQKQRRCAPSTSPGPWALTPTSTNSPSTPITCFTTGKPAPARPPFPASSPLHQRPSRNDSNTTTTSPSAEASTYSPAPPRCTRSRPCKTCSCSWASRCAGCDGGTRGATVWTMGRLSIWRGSIRLG